MAVRDKDAARRADARLSAATHDVVVLGGGPAGSAAAKLLADDGHSVALVRPAAPAGAALGESVPPSARGILRELGLLDPAEHAGFHPNRGNSVWWAGQPLRTEAFPDDKVGFHTDRAALEAVLVDAAAKAGARVYHRTSARTPDETAEGWRILCEGEERHELELRATWVIDATGRRGLLARGEGREPDRSTTTLALVRRWRRRGGWPGESAHHTLVESYEDGWAWSVPLDAEVRCFTAMVDQRHAELPGSSVESMLDAELAKTRHVGPMRDAAMPDGEAWACSASLYTAARFGRPGLLLAGDAGSFIDPLSSFGVKKALTSGWLAGIVVHTALADPPMIDAAVRFFDRHERDVYRSYRRVSAMFFESAAAAHGTPYWKTRAEAARVAGGPPGSEGVDPDRVSSDVPEHAVRSAFETIRSRPSLVAKPGGSLRTLVRPGIVGHRIVLQEHLASDAYPEGMRYVRGVDLSRLVEVVPRHTEAPDGWASYNDVAPPVTLPDYLTALATAFAAGFLEHADG